MLRTEITERKQISISGEFWELDRLYFAIAKIIGDYAAEPELHPYPELKKTCETLLALNYELKCIYSGERDIIAQRNGIRSNMFAPIGQEDRIIPEGWTREHHFGNNDFDLDIFELEILNTLPEEIDSDVYNELSNEGKGILLKNLGLDEDDVDEYVEWLNDDDRYIYRFAAKDYPGCGFTNTWLAGSIPFPDAILYALIIQLLIHKKDQFLAYIKVRAGKEDGMSGIFTDYYCSTVYLDYARITFFKESVFQNLYRIIGEDSHLSFRTFFEENIEKITDSNIMEIRDCTEKYSRLLYENSDNARILLTDYLTSLKKLL